MKLTRLSVFALVSLCAATTTHADGNSVISLIPKPQTLQVESGTFELTKHTAISFAGGEAEAQWLAARLRPATAFPLPVSTAGTRPGKGAIAFVLQPNLESQFGTEGYELSVTPKAVT